MTETFDLRLQGGFHLEAAEGGRPGRKLQAVLAYLALADGAAVARDALAAMFWGDRQDEQARQSVRQALSALRRALGARRAEALQSIDDAVVLKPEHLSCDTLSLQQALQAGDGAAALALFLGDLLAAVGAVTPDFDDWLEDARRRQRAALIGAAERLARDAPERLADMGEPLDRLAALEPASEAMARVDFVRFAVRGEANLLEARFTALRRTLKSDMGEEPSAETVQAHETALRTLAAAGSSSIATPRPQPASLAPTRPAHGTTPPPQPSKRTRIWAYAAAGLVFLAAALLGLRPMLFGSQSSAGGDAWVDGFHVAAFRSVDGGELSRALARALSDNVSTGFAMIAPLPAAETDAARYILDGTVEALDAQSVRVTARLRDRASRDVLFTRMFERSPDAVRDDVVRRLVIALEVALGEGEQASLEGTQDLEAWLLAGAAFEAFRAMTPEDLARAKRLYRDALSRDPNFENARIGLAWTHAVDLFFGWSPNPAAAQAVLDALTTEGVRDDTGSEAASTSALRGLLALHGGDHAQADALSAEAVRRFPSSSDLAAVRGFVLIQSGDPDAGLRYLQRAVDGQPTPADWIIWVKARALRQLGRPEAALSTLETARNRSASPVHLAEQAATLAALGRLEEARAATERLRARAPEFAARTWVARFPYRDPEAAAAEIAWLQAAGAP